MPSIITHDTFGQDVYRELYNFIGGSRDEAEAFLLGNQGPDPLFYSAAMPWLPQYRSLGNLMHDAHPSELLAAFKRGISFLPEPDQSIGRAYALGFLCHYTLDSIMHPYVFYYQYALCDAGEPGLTRDDGHELHAFIETELDELVLFVKRGETTAQFHPGRDVLKGSAHMLMVASTLYCYVAQEAYGRSIPDTLFMTSVAAMRLGQKIFHSSTGLKRELIGRAEELVRPYSFARAMSHVPVERQQSIFDNAECTPWENPFTGEVSTKSFWDLYDQALDQAFSNITTFDRPSFNTQAAREITRDRNFSGKMAEAQIIAVE